MRSMVPRNFEIVVHASPLSAVQRLQPALDVEGFDIVRDFCTPLWDKIAANDMLGVKDGALGLGAKRIRPEVVLEVVLREGVETECGMSADSSLMRATGRACPSSRRASRSFGKSRTRPTGNFLHSSAIRLSDPITQHPDISTLAALCSK